MEKLYNIAPKRIFTFGCSFTDYIWGTWANILGHEFKKSEFYNYGKSGAGNSYIANMVTQVDNFYKFKKDDLVLISWTNISREDRFLESRNGWLTPGNIYTQNEYDSTFVKKWANDTHFALRDYSTISLVDQYLANKTQYHFLSMCNISTTIDQWAEEKAESNISNLSHNYGHCLKKISPSFYETLWNNNLQNKWESDWNIVHKYFSDGHPLPMEHLAYLQKTFDYEFNSKTISSVKKTQNSLITYLRKKYDTVTKNTGLYEFDQKWQDGIRQQFKLRNSSRHQDILN